MNQIAEYPQDAKPTKSRRALKIVLSTIAAAALVTAVTWGGISWANGVAAHRAHLTAIAEQHQVESAKPFLKAQTAAAADESDTSTADDVVAAEKAREAAALAAQQAAAEAAYAAAHAPKAHRGNVGADGLIQCPAGSSEDAGDSNGATLCLPDICFHITLPDPAHPECVTAFKP